MTGPQDDAMPEGMVADKDVLVKVRDGGLIAVDVFRPEKPGSYPVIVSMSPYGKDVFWPDRFPVYETVDNNPRMTWETENPDRWVPHGYVVVRADSRGSGNSPGLLHPLSRREQEDAYDVVEWAGIQEWSNGKVGMSGISWFSMLAWLVAALRPPHLAAIIPWDGLSDVYREWAYQGGIPHAVFTPFWWGKNVAPNQYGVGELNAEELAANRIYIGDEMDEHPFVDGWHTERTADVENIAIPVLSATAWGSLHLHLRGNVEAFLRIKGPHRRLMVFPGDHISPFYTEWGFAARKRFFDRWLSGVRNGAESDAPVRLGLRSVDGTIWRDETQWPLAGTEWRALHLDAASGLLHDKPCPETVAAFQSPNGTIAFDAEATTDRTEITGPISLHLWVSSHSEDLDVYASLWQIDDWGQPVPVQGILGQQVPHTMGLLRASHRELDPEKSLPYRPYHAHRSALPIPVGEPYALDIEIWPTSMILEPGHRLRLVLAGSDFWLDTPHADSAGRATRNVGGVVEVLTGSEHDSFLLVPFVRGASERYAGGGHPPTPPTD